LHSFYANFGRHVTGHRVIKSLYTLSCCANSL